MKALMGKAALVTGAGSGIGRALVAELAGAGMMVGALDIDAAAAETAAAEARAGGGAAIGLACDVSDAAQMGAAFAQVEDRLGSISLFCANAGVTAFERLADMSATDIDWIYHVDFLAVSRGIRAVLPAMIAAGEGHIVATASMAGLAPTWVPYHVPYTAAKAGVIGMLMNLRPELAERGVGCTVVCPGGVATNILDSPRRRPDRFGGPTSGGITPPAGFRAPAGSRYVQRTAGEVARMTLEAVLADRPLVVTDPRMRGLYGDYATMVMRAFDDAERWEAANPSASSGA